jgi:hypothetical protein
MEKRLDHIQKAGIINALLPIMMEIFPVGDDEAVPYNGPYTLDDMRVAVCIAAEEGADCIKTWYSGDPKLSDRLLVMLMCRYSLQGAQKLKTRAKFWKW